MSIARRHDGTLTGHTTTRAWPTTVTAPRHQPHPGATVPSAARVGPQAADDARRDPFQTAMLPMDDVRPQTLPNS